MKKVSLLLICSLFLISCNMNTTKKTITTTQNIHETRSIIEWVDFVDINGNQYESIYSAIIADPNVLEKK
ncbi:hypothetical protein PB01_15140 [Psychrobacillus glaciei]|uniref:Uncharacterized protein n=1 Tax=Psychrobacillus glaciei TaxID=2283160 RepID=A0A5J6SQW7_9BACI|nr:hypothetical protein [Psychrobacillus glaciei]QFG00053.1 hypothetical protein PB01_15140 [Psychrobacillus glaciei]